MVWTLIPNLISLAASLSVAYAVGLSFHWHRPHPGPQVYVLVVGVPLLLVQLLLLLPLTTLVLRNPSRLASEQRARWFIAGMAWLPPGINLVTLVVGFVFGR